MFNLKWEGGRGGGRGEERGGDEVVVCVDEEGGRAASLKGYTVQYRNVFFKHSLPDIVSLHETFIRVELCPDF